MLTITIRYFAQLRELRGCEQESLSVETGATVSDVYQRLFGAHRLGKLTIAFALNHALVPATTLVSQGDELAFLPPVGGG